ncbi:MAG: hypothetical protein JJT94_17460 [Bernardetiaceae bacterium]|nr:hypothetical protein [Bernardetiaceae bacterium]
MRMLPNFKAFLFFIAIILLLLSSCGKKDEPEPAIQDVRLPFEGTFVMSSEFRNAEGQLERTTYELSITRYFQNDNQESNRLVLTNLADLRVASDAFVGDEATIDIPLQGYLFENTGEFISIEGSGQLVENELRLRYTVEREGANGTVDYEAVGTFK